MTRLENCSGCTQKVGNKKVKLDLKSCHGISDGGYACVWYTLYCAFKSEETLDTNLRDHAHHFTYFIENKMWYSDSMGRPLTLFEVRNIFRGVKNQMVA